MAMRLFRQRGVQLALIFLLFLSGCAALQNRNRLESLLEKFDSAPSPANLAFLTPAEKRQLLDVLREVSLLDTDQLRRFIAEYRRRRCTLPDDLDFNKIEGGFMRLTADLDRLQVLILYTTNITSETLGRDKRVRPFLIDYDDDRIPVSADCPEWPLVIMESGELVLGGSNLRCSRPLPIDYEAIFEECLEKYGRRIMPDGSRQGSGKNKQARAQ